MSALGALAVILTLSHGASAAGPTKEECIEAHGKGQDLRDEGKIAKARQLFLTCSQPSCPNLVQSDCARYAEDMSKLVPTLSFAARDAHANDLPNTQVYLDDALVATRLDDGKMYEVDPGKHVIRFVHDGKDTTVKIVVNQGEKGRNVIGTFVEPGAQELPAGGGRAGDAAGGASAPPEPHRSGLPLVVAGIGGAVAITGVVLTFVGLGKVPSNCSTSTHECAAPPGDKSFDDARSGVNMANLGVGLAIGGAVVAVGSVVWYLLQSPKIERTGKLPASPVWLGKANGGVSLAF